MPAKEVDDEAKVSWLEWVVFSVGLVLLLGTLGALTYEAFRYDSGPPELEVALGRPTRQGQGYVVPVNIRNTGGTTAAAVEVEVTAHFPDEEATSTATFQFAPRLSQAEGWVSFEEDPARADSLTARVLGYEDP